MELKEKVVSFSETRNAIEFVDKEIKSVFEKYDAEIAELKLKKEELSKKLDTTFSLIEEEIKAEFEKIQKLRSLLVDSVFKKEKTLYMILNWLLTLQKKKGYFLNLMKSLLRKQLKV